MAKYSREQRIFDLMRECYEMHAPNQAVVDDVHLQEAANRLREAQALLVLECYERLWLNDDPASVDTAWRDLMVSWKDYHPEQWSDDLVEPAFEEYGDEPASIRGPRYDEWRKTYKDPQWLQWSETKNKIKEAEYELAIAARG